jgi:hypothetical protein
MAGANVTINAASGSDGAQATKRRYGTCLAAVVDTTLDNCDIVDVRDYASIAVKPSAGITSLTVYSSDIASGTFVIVDSLGTAGAVTVTASKWNVIDLTKLPFGFLKFVPNSNGTIDVVGKT